MLNKIYLAGTKMREFSKLFIFALLIYFSKYDLGALGEKWFKELESLEKWADSVKIIRFRFWKSFLFITAFVLTIAFLWQWLFSVSNPSKYWARVPAVILALAATFCRGGWDIQTCSGKTVLERIDRGMFIISELGATSILLLALTL